MRAATKRKVIEYYKLQGDDYSRMYSNPRSAYRKRRRIEATRDFLQRWRPAMERVLEVGCGDGYFTSQLSDGCTWQAAVGVDLSSAKLKQFQGRIPASQVVSADAEALPFRSDVFDTVLCFEVLEHLVDPEAAVGEIWRVLKPGGLLVLSTPFVSTLHLFGKRLLLSLFPSLDSPEGFREHLQEFTSRRLRGLLCRNGFRLVAQRAFLYDFAILDSLFRYLPYNLYRRIDTWLGYIPTGTVGIGKLRVSFGAEYILVAAKKR